MGQSNGSNGSNNGVGHPPPAGIDQVWPRCVDATPPGEPRVDPVDAIESWSLPWHLGAVVEMLAQIGDRTDEVAIGDLRIARDYLDRYIALKEEG